MKTSIILTSLISSASFISAQCCDQGQANARANLLIGTAPTVATAKTTCCAKGCEEGSCECGDQCDTKSAKAKLDNQLNIAVEGMTCEGCSGKITKNLSAIEGVKVDKVCHKNGCATVTIDPAKTNREAVVKAIKDSGYKVTGDVVHFDVTGMKGAACSEKISAALEGLEGVTVKKVCHQAGCTDVVISGNTTDKAAVEKAIQDLGFQVK